MTKRNTWFRQMSVILSLSLARIAANHSSWVCEKKLFDGHDEYVDDAEETKKAMMMMMMLFSVSKASHNILPFFPPLVDTCAVRCDRIKRKGEGREWEKRNRRKPQNIHRLVDNGSCRSVDSRSDCSWYCSSLKTSATSNTPRFDITRWIEYTKHYWQYSSWA